MTNYVTGHKSLLRNLYRAKAQKLLELRAPPGCPQYSSDIPAFIYQSLFYFFVC